MKQTLINKYLAGETNISEERELKQLLLDIPTAQQSKAERSILELLSYSESEEVEEDIFAVDYTEEYDKHVRPSRTIRLWPWLAAACVAALLVVFLAPPREETQQMAEAENTIVSQKELKDSVKAEPVSLPMQEEKQLAQVAENGSSSTVKQDRKKTENVVEASHNDVAMAETSDKEENYELVTSVADERMEEFYASSANIHRCGQQLMHRVSMNNNPTSSKTQYTNL